MDAPFVMQCRACRAIVSDSNELVGTKPDEALLLLKAVIAVQITTYTQDPLSDRDATCARCECSNCRANLGRVYQRPPERYASFAPPNTTPLYLLDKEALQSFMLGSVKAQHDAAAMAWAASGGGGRDGGGCDGGGGDGGDSARSAPGAARVLGSKRAAPSGAGSTEELASLVQHLAARVAKLETSAASRGSESGATLEALGERVSRTMRSLLDLDARVETLECRAANQ